MALRIYPFTGSASVALRLGRSLALSVSGLAGSLLGNAVIFLLIASSVRPAEFGLFAKSYACVSLITLIVDFGYQQRILHELVEFQERFGGLPTRILHLKLVLAGLCLTIALPAIILLDLEPAIVVLVAIGLLTMSFGHVGGATLRATGRHGRDSTHLLIANIAGASFAAALAALEIASVVLFSCSFVIIGFIYLVLSGSTFISLMPLVREKFSAAALTDEFRKGLSFGSDAIVVRSYGVVDVLVLSIFASPTAIGIYQVGQKLMQMILPAAQVLTNVTLPLLSRRFRRAGPSDLTLGALIAVLGLASLIAYGVFTIGSNLVLTYFLDKDFETVRMLLPLFAMTVAMRIWAVAPSLWLIAAGVQKIRLIANAVSLAVFIGLLFFLVPSGGARGAALATAIAGVWSFISYAAGTRFFGCFRNPSIRKDSSSAIAAPDE